MIFSLAPASWPRELISSGYENCLGKDVDEAAALSCPLNPNQTRRQVCSNFTPQSFNFTQSSLGFFESISASIKHSNSGVLMPHQPCRDGLRV